MAKGLDDFGFADLLAEAPRDAVSALFTALGRAGSMTTALQDVLLQPLADCLPVAATECNVVLPAVGADLVGVTEGAEVSVRGLVIGARPAANFFAPVALGVNLFGSASARPLRCLRGEFTDSIPPWR